MKTMIPVLIILAALSVVAVLLIGVFSMIKGGEFNEKYGNRLMQARVALQGLTLLLLALAYSMSHS